MGNFAARCYIYSSQLPMYDKQNFYQNDISKVVFVAPPFWGSDIVIGSWKLWSDAGITFNKERISDWQHVISAYNGINNFFHGGGLGGIFDFGQIMSGFISGTLQDPISLYMIAAWFCSTDIYVDEVLKSKFGFGYPQPWDGGMWDMLPRPLSLTADELQNAQLPSPTSEPSYSIIYGRGVPVYDAYSSFAMAGIRNLQSFGEKKYYNGTIPGYPGALANIVKLDYKWLTLAHPNFWNLPNGESKFLSFLQANVMGGFYTNDGDGAVPTYSAKGEEIAHLKNAKRYEHMFRTEAVDNYFSNNFMSDVAIVESTIAMLSVLTKAPPSTFWPLKFTLAMKLVVLVADNKASLRQDILAHERTLDLHDEIRTALLDDPAVLTIQDIQAMASAESSATPEGRSISTRSISAPSGLSSIGIKSVTEKREYAGLTNMPFPITLDGQRIYASALTVTKPPKRIEGKLNYLIPSLMKRFDYSFNFAAWKPITGVNPETGNFVLEDLPFAEGQNVIAVRSENAVGVKSSQQMIITVNTIPILPAEFVPAPNSYTSNNQPEMSVVFSRAIHSTDPPEFKKETVILKNETTGQEWDVTSDAQMIPISKDAHTEKIKIIYTPPIPLPDGRYIFKVGVSG